MNATQPLQAGKKHDHGKVQPDLILSDMSRAILAVAEVATFGADKYAAGNWLHVDDAINRYRNAKQRHMLLGATEACDEESGLLHAAHEAWNALAVLELMLRCAQVTPAGQAENLPGYVAWAVGEARMDVVGTNGNDGAHYSEAGFK